MKRIFCLIMVFAAVFAFASCSKKKSHDYKEQVSKEISAKEGGTIESSDGNTSIEIPSGALDEDTTITMTIRNADGGYAGTKNLNLVSWIVEFEPSGTVFKKPIIISMSSLENVENKIITAAVYNEAKGDWSYSETGAAVMISGKDASGDPIMTSAAGDPIMLNAAGDPIMMSASGDPIMMSAAGDPIMVTAAGDPIMNSAAGDPIMMTTGHFTAYAFITIPKETADIDNDIPATTDEDEIPDEIEDEDEIPDVDEDVTPVYVPECGNGVLDPEEECDNGEENSDEPGVSGTTCRKDCTLAACGDAIVDTNEFCDSGLMNGSTDCEYGETSCSLCTTECKLADGAVSYCGDGTKDEANNEACDNGQDNGKTDCAYGETSCSVCTTECKLADGVISYCGDGTKQSNEACDKADSEYGKGEGIGAACSDDCQIVTLSCGTLPANAQWVSGDTYKSTWDGSAYSSASAHYAEEGDCAYQCKPTFTWFETDGTCACTDEEHVENGVCTSNTQAAASCGTLPDNAAWVSGDTYIPTWNGDGYTSASANYAESGECAYQCKPTFTWFETDGTCACTNEEHVEDSLCVSNTGDAQNCTNLPENAAWKVSTYTPHWSGEAWSPEPAATYFEDEGEECTYECAETYHYDYEEENCQSDTRPPESCGELPENAQWVKGDTYIPTWNGKGFPYITAHYAEEGDCAFICIEDYEWNYDTVKCQPKCGNGRVDLENGEVCDKADPSVGVGEGIGTDCSDDCHKIYNKVLCTGQTKCSDGESIIDCPLEGEALYGQDANYVSKKSCVPNVFTKGENEQITEVHDETTGLWWLFIGSAAEYENADAYCNNYGDQWRLPTPKELMSLLNSDASYPSARQAYIPMDDGTHFYWSNTSPAASFGEGAGDNVLVLDFGMGMLQYSPKTNGNTSVRFACVNGDEYGAIGEYSIQTVGDDEIVRDSSTNLIWQKDYEVNKTWEEALSYCENLNYAGYSDWRLPNRNELVSLVDYSNTTGDPVSSFPGMPASENFWTSTFVMEYGGANGFYVVNMSYGEIKSSDDSDILTASVRCVRSNLEPYPEGKTIPYCNETGYTPCENTDGKVWSQDINYNRTYRTDYFEIAQMCRESTQGGILQWRIPTIDELRTILDSEVFELNDGTCELPDACDQSNGNCYDIASCNTGTKFESIFHDASFLISGTPVCGDVENSWKVNLKEGKIEPHNNEIDLFPNPSIRCIQDPDIPVVVKFPYTDTRTNLIWSSRSPDEMNWEEMINYCDGIKEGEEEGIEWRLPSVDELKTLVSVDCPENVGCEYSLSGKYSVFGEILMLWSEEMYMSEHYKVLDFTIGIAVEDVSSAYVRCVSGELDEGGGDDNF